MRFVHHTTTITSEEGTLRAVRYPGDRAWRLEVNRDTESDFPNAVRHVWWARGERVADLLEWGASMLRADGASISLARTRRYTTWADPERRCFVRGYAGRWQATRFDDEVTSGEIRPTREAAWRDAAGKRRTGGRRPSPR